MTKVLAIVLVALAAGAACATAQEAPDCEAPLAQLRDQLERARADLTAAEGTSTSCSEEAAGLRAKLQEAEGALAASADAAKELQAKLEAAEAALAAAPDAAALQAEKRELAADAKIAKDSLSAARQKLAALEERAGTCDAELHLAQTELQSAKLEVAGLQDNTEQARVAITRCMGQQEELKDAAEHAEKKAQEASDEVAKLRAEVAAAEGAWLPPWAAASLGPALARTQELAKQYSVQGSAAAQQAWQSHGKPALARGLAVAHEKASRLNAAIEAKAGDSWPKVKAAAATAASAAATHGAAAAAAARKAALAAWESEAVAAVRPALVAAWRRAAAQARVVLGELEELLIRVLAKNNNTAALARRPYVTYLVYGALVVPLVAFGMPLLGLRRSKAKPAGSSPSSGGAPMSTKKKKSKPVGRAH